MKNTRIVTLFKDPNNDKYTNLGEIRTIANSPDIIKLYKLCIHYNLELKIEKKI